MIIQNGTIEFKAKTGGVISTTTGHPIVPATTSWGTPIPCQYIPIAHDKLAVSNEEHYTFATWTVLVEEQTTALTGEQIRLKDMTGATVGEYSIKSIEYLEAVCESKITI